MSTQTAQRYIVHLEIEATGVDPAEAVRNALERVQLDGPEDFDCTVEEVSLAELVPVWERARSYQEPEEHSRYPNEFLG